MLTARCDGRVYPPDQTPQKTFIHAERDLALQTSDLSCSSQCWLRLPKTWNIHCVRLGPNNPSQNPIEDAWLQAKT